MWCDGGTCNFVFSHFVCFWTEKCNWNSLNIYIWCLCALGNFLCLWTLLTAAHFIWKLYRERADCSSRLPLDLRFLECPAPLLCFDFIMLFVGTLTTDVLVSGNTPNLIYLEMCFVYIYITIYYNTTLIFLTLTVRRPHICGHRDLFAAMRGPHICGHSRDRRIAHFNC